MKMSDALRGAADSAPIADVHIETAGAAKRVRRNRAVRTGANGVVGVGAAALVVAGVMGAIANQTGVPAAEFADGAGSREGDLGTAAMEPGLVAPDDSMLACGYAFDPASYPTGAVTAAATLGDFTDGNLQLDVAYSTSTDGTFTIDIPGVYVVWDGIVVANTGFTTDGAQATVTADEPATRSGATDLVNCWDGSALPAGDYTIVTVTPVSASPDLAPPVAEPTAGPKEPSVAPDAPKPPIDPVTEPSDGDVSISSDDAVTTDVAEAPPTYAVSEAVALTIAGDAVKDPFGQYLNPEPVPTPDLPSDALTTDAARKAYEAALAGPWNMAAGTQRVVKTGDGSAKPGPSTAYFGCAMEGSGEGFPAESAELDWLGVDASLPTTLDVSYGWIVNGNPLIGFGLTNTSKWSLPGFYSGATPHLVLVRDGKVIAEAWPVNPDNNGGGAIAYSEGDSQGAAEDAKLIWAPVDDYLAPGEQVSGEYLWRDVNGCWAGDKQTDVTPGNYTVLTVQDIFVGGSYPMLEGDPAAAARDLGGENSDEPSLVAPDSGFDDYISFQVWTSLGELRVTN